MIASINPAAAAAGLGTQNPKTGKDWEANFEILPAPCM
jgi:hypothetical protein